jgi:hypothetical protein
MSRLPGIVVLDAGSFNLLLPHRGTEFMTTDRSRVTSARPALAYRFAVAGAVLGLQACSVLSTAGSAVSTAASVAGTAASTAASVVGSADKAGANAVSSGSTSRPAESSKP